MQDGHNKSAFFVKKNIPLIILKQRFYVNKQLRYVNYPNPFNPTTNIKFDLSQSGFAKLVIYDILGREVNTLVSENVKAGEYQISFDASNLPSGVYFYRLTVTNGQTTSIWTATKKLILVK